MAPQRVRIRMLGGLTTGWDVVVGGGVAGCVLASRLSEAVDRSVLRLEARRRAGGCSLI